MVAPFSIITALYYDPDQPSDQALFLLDYHRDRLVKSVRFFGWPQHVLDKIGICDIRKAVSEANKLGDISGPFKARLLLSQSHPYLACTLTPTVKRSHEFLAMAFEGQRPQVPTLRVYIDTATTAYPSTSAYKTTDREIYNAARSRCLKLSTDEVLMHNSDNFVSEGSIRNVYFFRDGCWLTPRLSTGALDGVVRRWLLDNETVIEGNILLRDVKVGEEIILTNGVEGCTMGRIETWSSS